MLDGPRGWKGVVSDSWRPVEAEADDCVPSLEEMIASPTSPRWEVSVFIEGREKVALTFLERSEATAAVESVFPKDGPNEPESMLSRDRTVVFGPDSDGSSLVFKARLFQGAHLKPVLQPQQKSSVVATKQHPQPKGPFRTL